LTAIRDAAQPNDRFLELGYPGGDALIQSVSDGVRTVQYGYAANGDLTSVIDVMGRTTTYAYVAHLLTRITDPLGQVVEDTAYETPYLASSRALSQTLQDGRQLQFTYLAASTVITMTGVDGRQEVEEIMYTPRNTMSDIVFNGKTRQETAHNDNFCPSVIADGNGHATTVVFNNEGRPEQISNALGETTQVAYNDQNLPTVITDTLRRRSELAYDADNNLIRQTTSITNSFPGFTTLYTYTATWLSEQQGPDGVVTRYERNAQGQVLTTTLGAGTSDAQVTIFGYDALGRMVTTTVGVGTALQRADVTRYNADDSVAERIQNYQDGGFDPRQPDTDIVTRYGYDALGRQIWVRDVLGRYDVTHYATDGRVDWTARNLTGYNGGTSLPAQPPAFDPAAPDANVATFYGYDGLGRTSLVTQTGILTGTFDPGLRRFSAATERVTRTEYDDQSRPITVTLNYQPSVPAGPDVNVQTLTQYDLAGNVTGQRDALGRWSVTAYDALNRPITVTLNYENGDPLT
ncbi:MAG: hypothetical protein MI924_38515, partial [Chloroflexales bacterium]|nr:hypothetical protein [Chloroflexales bacterium]